VRSTVEPDSRGRIFPKRYQDATLATFDTNGSDRLLEALTAARAVVSGTNRNLVLVGPPGVGKTHLAVGVVRAILDRDVERYRAEVEESERPDRIGTWHPRLPDSPQWVNVASLIVSLRMQMDAPLDDRTGAETVRILRRQKGIVVLDDLGREKVSDWTGEIVYDLVNSRYENELPTIVTSNLTPAELAGSPYWPAISRLAEDGALVRIEAPDHRLARSA